MRPPSPRARRWVRTSTARAVPSARPLSPRGPGLHIADHLRRLHDRAGGERAHQAHEDPLRVAPTGRTSRTSKCTVAVTVRVATGGGASRSACARLPTAAPARCRSERDEQIAGGDQADEARVLVVVRVSCGTWCSSPTMGRSAALGGGAVPASSSRGHVVPTSTVLKLRCSVAPTLSGRLRTPQNDGGPAVATVGSSGRCDHCQVVALTTSRACWQVVRARRARTRPARRSTGGRTRAGARAATAGAALSAWRGPGRHRR